MELIRFDANTAPSISNRALGKKPTMSVRYGLFLLNKKAAKVMGVSPGYKVTLFQHPDHKDTWYIGKDSDGFELREDKTGVKFNSLRTAYAIRESIGLNGAVKFILSPDSDFEGTHALLNPQLIISKTK